MLTKISIICLPLICGQTSSTCVNVNDSLCEQFGIQFCTDTAYYNGILFKTFCAKLCQNCKSRNKIYHNLK